MRVVDVEILRIGRGYEADQVRSTLSELGDDRIELVDSRLADNRNRGQTVSTDGPLFATRVVIDRNDAIHGVVRAHQRIRFEDVTFSRNLSRHGVALESYTSIDLIGSLVVRTQAQDVNSPPVIGAPNTVRLLRSIVRDNETFGSSDDKVAVRTQHLVADHAVVRHGARACWVTGTTDATSSIASDRSCGF
jgi:hypothetical protein